MITPEIIVGIVFAWALADFALQPSDMAKYKNRHKVPENIPVGQKLVPVWPYWLTAHALIHGGCLWFFTGIWWLMPIETLAHWITDFAKCENKTTPNGDQLFHWLARGVYIAIIAIFYV